MMAPRNPEVSILLSIESLNKVLNLLGTHPFNDVAELIVEIRNQANQQLQQMQSAGAMPPRPNGEDRPRAD